MKLKTYRPIPTNPAKLFDNKVICTITTKITLMSGQDDTKLVCYTWDSICGTTSFKQY